MMRIFLISLFIFITSSVFGQTINLQWEGTQTVDFGRYKLTIPSFSNKGFSYERGSIFYRGTEKFTGESKRITNLQWEKISQKDIYDLDLSSISDREILEVNNYRDPYNGIQTTNYLVATLKQEKGVLYRLSSFTIENSNTSSLSSRAIPILGTTDNPLKSGTFYKIKVDKSGVFKITAKFLRDNGINPANINPRNFRIYGNGGVMLPEHNLDPRFSTLQQNAIQVVGEEDGDWGNEDYALFYAQGPHGFNLYKSIYTDTTNRRIETRKDLSGNVINIYDDFSYYFINFDLGPGKRIQTSDQAITTNAFTRYDEFQYLNEEKFNLMKVGRSWTGDAFTSNKKVEFTTKTPLSTDERVIYRTRLVGYQSSGNSIGISINGQQQLTFSISPDFRRDYYPILYQGEINGLQGNTLSFNYDPNIAANPNGKFYFDYAEVQYRQDLKYSDGQFSFRRFDIAENSGNSYAFSIADAATIEQVWDVSDVTNVSKKTNRSNNNSTFTFGYIANRPYFTNEFIAFKNSDAYSPDFVGRIENQDLSSLQNIDYLMITVPEMMGNAQRLAAYYENKYNVAVVDVNKIYNEFSSGRKDITAIRDFATKLNTPKGQLKYLFILGDTSYDFKGKVNPGSDVVPSYQSEESRDYELSFVTDDYYTMTSPQLPTSTALFTTLPDFPVGRLPAANVTEAKLLINKTLAYYNALPGQSTPFGEWRMKMDFVVDDDADNRVPFHNTMDNALKTAQLDSGYLTVMPGQNPPTTLYTNNKPEYYIRKLYLDSFTAQTSAGGQRFPQINQAITNDMGNSLYMFYFGHGGINGWAQERVLSLDEIQNFNNYNNVYSRFPLVSTITCEFTLWDEPSTFSAGEQVMKSKQGGASMMLTSSRAIAVGYGEVFTTILTRRLFEINNDNFNAVGDAFLKAKIEKGPDENHLKVNLLGDPAAKLSRPQRLLQIDAVESPVPGQLRALDFVKIKGHINKADGTIDTDFNGRVAINIFDKRVAKKTLNNDNDPLLSPVLNYTEENSPIVKSSGQAKNGVFVVEFYVPKDINYDLGEGRLLAYADNKAFDVFNNQPQKIGGINPEGINDSEPPKLQLYMNNTNFADGGITNQNPTFLACVTDDKGINSTGSGIGHDITVVLDGKVIDTVVLNDFYFSGDGNGCTNTNLADYQKGNVTYPFRNLSPGPHQLTFKVWDINNNSTTGTLNFVVKDESEEKLTIVKPLNWPNPFTNKTYIHFEHNCDDLLDVNVQIYSITGKLVRTISSTVTAEPFLQGFRTPRTAIEWDGRDDFGDTVGKGTYIYKIFAKSQNQEKCKGSASAVEKMVLLK